MKKLTILILLTVMLTAAFIPAAASGNEGAVMEKPAFDFNKNILISIFWPPTPEYINDEQYKYMADAEIDWVLGAGDGTGTKANQMKMLELCDKYGIGMCVGDDRFGGNLLNMSDSRIKKLVSEYKDVPGAYGYYMLDEPFNANVFINAYKSLKEADPNGYMHLNFLPGHAYPSYTMYESQMNDWLKLCAATGHPQEYVMYDMYPFPLQAGSISREPMMKNLESVRKVGLANNVKTAMYIQSVSQTAAFRSLNREETLFEFNIGLAFGIKQFSYFTWFTPHDRSEPFDDGIITYDGKPNKKYTFICELDKLIHNVGKTLINLDAYEVYGSSNGYGAIEKIPDGFFVHVKGKSDLTVSYMRDKNTGRNYCMVVNNLFNKKQSFSLEFDADIGALQYLSYEDGKLYDLDKEGNAVKAELDKGEALIIALPEGYDYSAKTAKEPEPGTNLALDAQIFCDTSEGAGGWYMDNLNNGKRFSEASDNGWKTSNKTGLGEIIIDLCKVRSFDRIDLYPAGTADNYGANFPKAFRISYSSDKEKWYTLAEASDFAIINKVVPSLRFDKTEARYVRIEITEANAKVSDLCEIEIYGGGSVPEPDYVDKAQAPAERGTYEVKYRANSNIALNKSVTVSSAPGTTDYKTWGWWPDYVCDGSESTGWTSNVKIHMNDPNSTEYCIIDLGDVFSMSKIVVKALGCWPSDFDISISDDLSEWITLAEEKGSKSKGYELEIDGKVGRYVKFRGTKLTGTASDGYMLQLSEIEVYGAPYKNAKEAEELIAEYVKAGGSEDSESCKAVKDILSDENKTQSQLDKKLAAMLAEVGLKIPAPEEKEIPTAKYEVNYGPYERPDSGTEPVTEPAADTETEPVETKAETEKATEPLTERPAEAEGKDSYLGLKIAAVALAVLAVGAALAFVWIKRRKK